MKLKNSQIMEFATLDLKEKKLPVRLMYALSMNMSAVSSAIMVYNEQRTELLKKYAKKDENGELLVEDDHYIFEDVKGWNESITELLNSDTEVPITTVPISVIEKCDSPDFYDLSLEDIAAISFMIENA